MDKTPFEGLDQLGLASAFSNGREMELDRESIPEILLAETPFAEGIDDYARSQRGDREPDAGPVPAPAPTPAASSAGVTFPSGLVLAFATDPTKEGEEHWDPHSTGLRLLATD